MPADVPLDPHTLLSAYAQGVFPMSDDRGHVQWHTADPRGILPLETFHIPGTLRSLVKKSPQQGGFEIRINSDFQGVMRGCAEARRGGTWIDGKIIAAYCRLHTLGFAHSVETWKDGRLAGGTYGVSLGGAFFGESMFHRETNASKVALVHLVARLKERGFVLLDTQAVTSHLSRFGCIEIPAREYLMKLNDAIKLKCDFA